MAYYRSIKDSTVQVEAVKNDGSRSTLSNIRDLISVTGETNLAFIKKGEIFVKTSQGTFVVPRGYYVVLDSSEEVFVSSPTDFDNVYEAGESTSAGGGTLSEVSETLSGDYYTKTEVDTWRNSVTQTEMGYVNGVTSDIQTQLNAKDNYQSWTIAGDTGTDTVASTNTITFAGASQSNYLGIGTFYGAGSLDIRLDINSLDAAAAVDNSSDAVLLYDNSASKNTKTTPESLIAATTALMESDFGVNNTILIKNSSGTITTTQLVEQTIAGRITGGEITGLTAGQVQTLLGLGTMAYEATGSYYTQTNLQTSGQASVHWDNITNTPDHNELGGIQGGSADNYYHMTSTEYINVGNLDSMAYEATGSYYTSSEVDTLLGDYADISGTPVLNQLTIWHDADTIKGDSNLTWDGSTLQVTGTMAATTVTGANVTSGSDPGHTHSGYASVSGTPSNNEIAVWTDADTIEGESNVTFNGGVFNVTGTLTVDTEEVYDRGDIPWIDTDNDSTPGWNFSTSHNFVWAPTSQATGTLSITNMDDGDSGILLIASDTNGILTLPATSDPSTIAYTSSAVIVATVFKWVNGATTRYIWSTRSTSVSPT